MADAVVEWAIRATETGTDLLTGEAIVSPGTGTRAASASGVPIPASIPAGGNYGVRWRGRDEVGNLEAWRWRALVRAAASQWPEALGPNGVSGLTALPSWTNSTQVVTSGRRDAAGDIPEDDWTPLRTYEMPNLPASGRDITSAWNAVFGSGGSLRDRDVVTIPAGTWFRGNLDIKAGGKRYRLVGGTASLSASARLVSTSPTQHAVRVMGSGAGFHKGASKTARLEYVCEGVAGRGDQNQQGMTTLLLDSVDQTGSPKNADGSDKANYYNTGFRAQDVLLKGARAAGFFTINYVSDFWLNRVEVQDSLADARHITGGCSYGVYTDCIVGGHGDDGNATVHYAGRDPLERQSHHIQTYRDTILPNAHGRGWANVSCRDIVGDQVRVVGSASGGLLMDSAETYGSTYARPAITGCHVRRVELVACNWGGDDHGSGICRAGTSPATLTDTIWESVKVIDAKGNRQGIRAFGGSAPVVRMTDFLFTGGAPSSLLGPLNQANGADSIVQERWVNQSSTSATPSVDPVITFENAPDGAILKGTLSGFPSKDTSLPSGQQDYVGTVDAKWWPRNTYLQTNTQVIQGKAGATRGITKVEIYIDSTLIYTQTSFDADGSWKTGVIDTTAYSDGAHSIRGVVTAVGGRTKTDTRSVTIANTVPADPVPTATGGRPSTSQTLLMDVDAAGSGTVDQPTAGIYATSGAPARSFKQGALADQPLCVAGPLNGQKAVKFDGGYLQALSTGISGVTRATFSFIMRVDSASANRPAIFSAAAPATDDWQQGSGAWNWTAPRLAGATTWDSSTIGGSVVSTNDATVTVSPAVPFGKWVLVEVEVGADGGTAKMWVDGVQVADLAGRTVSAGLLLANMALGSRTYSNGFADRSRYSLARLLVHQGARPSTTLAWAKSTYGVAA